MFENVPLSQEQIEQHIELFVEEGYLEVHERNGEPAYRITEEGEKRFKEVGPYDPEREQELHDAKLERLADAMTQYEAVVFKEYIDWDGVFLLPEEVAERTPLTPTQAEEALIGLSALGIINPGWV